jgi:hypothetical protein
MDRYQVAEKENGPWLELVMTNNPHQALAKARSCFGWPTIWVAKMKILRGRDVLPPPEIFWADIMERASVLYGTEVADELSGKLNEVAFRQIEMVLTGHFLDLNVDILIPDIKHPYGKDQAVKAIHFLEPTSRKPSLKDLMD